MRQGVLGLFFSGNGRENGHGRSDGRAAPEEGFRNPGKTGAPASGGDAPVTRAKTFGIGLSRTGTTSLTLALEALGLSVAHFPTTMKQIEEHDAATDTPVAASFQSLDSRFPGSKFIYTDSPDGLPF